MSHPINKTSDLKCKRKEGRKQKRALEGGGGSELEGQEKERKTKQQMITHRGGIWGGGGGYRYDRHVYYYYVPYIPHLQLGSQAGLIWTAEIDHRLLETFSMLSDHISYPNVNLLDTRVQDV